MSWLSAYKGARVFVTGHTGFKGSWLCEILLLAGAEVHGYALRPPTRPALFSQLSLARRIKTNTIGDIRDMKSLREALKRASPDFVFHLAAQPLVRVSYEEPVVTFDVNVMGTVNLLEAVRMNMRITGKTAGKDCGICSVVCVTTDKCYENNDSGRPFRETDPLGGSDPYSASKGACEIAIASYRRSFFSGLDSTVRIASARAGNVVGGGDWARDRIVPDAMRAFLSGRELGVRNAESTRPWQHVLEPLVGYLMLGVAMKCDEGCAGAFNFGPDDKAMRTVSDIVKMLARRFQGAKIRNASNCGSLHEAKLLSLDSSKARKVLGWKPHWDFDETVRKTAEWYKAVSGGGNPQEITDAQIREYFQ